MKTNITLIILLFTSIQFIGQNNSLDSIKKLEKESCTHHTSFERINNEWIPTNSTISRLNKFQLLWENENSAHLTKRQKNEIDKVIKILKDDNIELEINTHNTEVSHLSLNEKRNHSISNYLISKGIEANRVKFIGFGENNLELNKNIKHDFTTFRVNFAASKDTNENIRIGKIESFRPEIKKLKIDEAKFKRITLLSENRRSIISQCKTQTNPPHSHRKFNKIQLYSYERVDGSVDIEFFKKLFSPKGKFDNLKISNLNGFYKPVECECEINNKKYKVGVAWFYGVISSLNITNKSGELKLSALDIVSASVTLGRSTVSGKIYGEGLYSDDMNIDFDLSTFSVKEYGNYNIFVKDYLNLRKSINKGTTFSPTLILLELYELNN